MRSRDSASPPQAKWRWAGSRRISRVLRSASTLRNPSMRASAANRASSLAYIAPTSLTGTCSRRASADTIGSAHALGLVVIALKASIWNSLFLNRLSCERPAALRFTDRLNSASQDGYPHCYLPSLGAALLRPWDCVGITHNGLSPDDCVAWAHELHARPSAAEEPCWRSGETSARFGHVGQNGGCNLTSQSICHSHVGRRTCLRRRKYGSARLDFALRCGDSGLRLVAVSRDSHDCLYQVQRERTFLALGSEDRNSTVISVRTSLSDSCQYPNQLQSPPAAQNFCRRGRFSRWIGWRRTMGCCTSG